ncbi:hypothetical protein JAAARDRAFT_209371 [Jaapia argillacea MUCL 33604]|uniref:Protein kinase domain-containing protein n=1 Tax=Jaapia argillacea MUCL 33604 TaxID=933084 RepID=A0A067PTU9_9AGAM|nr:hypothetical protein JAAARDRAFT_209371 [Jaapia argillacea MUCL 33604]
MVEKSEIEKVFVLNQLATAAQTMLPLDVMLYLIDSLRWLASRIYAGCTRNSSNPIISSICTGQFPDPKYTTRRAIATARAESITSRINPLIYVPVYGENPYTRIWTEYTEADPAVHSLPPLTEVVPPLKELHITARDLTCLEVLRDYHEVEHVSSVFKVGYRGATYILKAYRASGDLTRTDPFRINDGLFRFHHEKQAYEHLLHFGVCAKGFVPDCYGWFKLPVDDVSWLHAFASDPRPPNAILLEYIDNAVQLDISNITVSIAENALTAISHIHQARVLHCDLYPRNHLILPDGRVVIIDFDAALTRPDDSVNLLELNWEKAFSWGMYYRAMLPDRLIGLTPDQATLY